MVVLCIEVGNKGERQVPEEYELSFRHYGFEVSLGHLDRDVSGRLLAT